MKEILNQIEKEIHEVISQIDEKQMSTFADRIRPGKRIFVDGEGRSGFSARGFAMRLMHLGYTVYFVGETITPAVKEGDVFIAVSGSGTSANVINDANRAKDKGAEVIAVTSKNGSQLALLSDYVFVISGTVKGDSGEARHSIQLLSSLFDQSLHIVLDAVCLIISQRDHTANEKAVRSHW